MNLDEVIKLIREIGENLTKTTERIAKLENEKRGSGELKEQADRIIADISKEYARAGELRDLATKCDELAAKLARGVEAQEKAGVKDTRHRKAIFDCVSHEFDFGKVSKETHDFIQSEEYQKYVRDIVGGTAPSGGVFLDPFTEQSILKNFVEIDPVRKLARVIPIQKSEYKSFRQKTNPQAEWEGETGDGTAKNATWEDIIIPVHGLVSSAVISSDMLDDVPFLENEIVTEAATQFSYTEGNAFIEGNGVKKPLGIMHGAGTDDDLYIPDITGNGTNIIDADDFPDMAASLKSPYQANAVWGMNRNSLGKVMKLTDANGYLVNWQMGYPFKISGRPIELFESLDDEGADVFPVIFGDFRMGYYIIDRAGITIQRDPFTQFPKVVFKMRKRVSGMLVKPEAMVALKTT